MQNIFVVIIADLLVVIWQALKLSLGKPGERQSRTARQKRKRSVGDYCLIWLFWSLVVVHLWTYKFFFLILPVPIVCVVLKKLGLFVHFCYMIITQ